MAKWNVKLPRWGGEVIEPPTSKQNEGYKAQDRPPAKWENWFRKQTYLALKETRVEVEKSFEEADAGIINHNASDVAHSDIRRGVKYLEDNALLSKDLADSNWDDLDFNGIYGVDPSNLTQPLSRLEAYPYGVLTVVRSVGNLLQTYIPHSTGGVYTRVFVDTWGDWKANGTVESGDNEHGQYVRFADGTQVCKGVVSKEMSLATAWGSVYKGVLGNAVYPATFSSVPSVALGATGPEFCLIGSRHSSVTHTPTIEVYRPLESQAVVTYSVSYTAIGRWY